MTDVLGIHILSVIFFFFLTDSVSVVLASPSVPLPQEEAIKELITESVEVNNTGQVPFLYYHIFLHSESVFFFYSKTFSSECTHPNESQRSAV